MGDAMRPPPMAGGPPPMGGAPPGGPPPGGPTPGTSVFNKQDATLFKSSGEMGANTTIGQFYEKMGIKWETPLNEAMEIIKQQAAGADTLGNTSLKANAPQGPPAGPPPAGGPPVGGPPAGPPQGLAGLIGR